MTVYEVMQAINSNDVCALEHCADVDLCAFIGACRANRMTNSALLYACKCFVLDHPHWTATCFLESNGHDMRPLRSGKNADALMVLAVRLMEDYDDATVLRAMTRAASMSASHLLAYTTRSTIADLVAQCSNRDDHTRAKGRRRR